MRKLDKLMIIMSALALIAFAVTLPSFGRSQNANSSTTQNANSSSTNRAGERGGVQQDFSKNTWELPEDADKTKNPIASNAESIEKGKTLFLERTKGNCIFCHGETGAGNEANLPRLRRKPADLSNKERMTAMTDGEVFWKISKGIQGIMPAGDRRMTEEERWHVVNYVRTLAKAQ